MNQYTVTEYNNEQIRRQDRLLEREQALEILQNGEYGVLSMQTEDGSGAYGIPLNYVWDGKSSIYIHCAPSGRKLMCIETCMYVSFCVVGQTRIVQEKFTAGYESIVMRCTARYCTDNAERMAALGIFVEKYCPDYRKQGMENAEKSFHRTGIIRLDIMEISGKSKRLF